MKWAISFEIDYTEHECNARRLLMQQGIKTVEELAVMTSWDVEQAINSAYKCLRCGEHWLLIPRNKVEDFESIATFILH